MTMFACHRKFASAPQKLTMTTSHMFLVVTLILFNVAASLSQGGASSNRTNIREIEKKILDHILNGGYDSKIRPSGAKGEGPTIVSVNMYLRQISNIDDYKMEYSTQITFREQWLDERLRFDNLKEFDIPEGKLRYVTLNDPSRVWMPDLFFTNEKEGHLHNIVKPNVYIRIHPNGEVLFSQRISLTLSCPMILKLFPLDKQTCIMRMASYAWTTEDVIFKWKRYDPVQVTSNLHLPRFSLQQFTSDYCDSQTNSGTYSCLRVDLLFAREFKFYLDQIYIPCLMFVIISYLSFWLDPNAVLARIFVGLGTLLTMATFVSEVNKGLPPVSYSKALDIWTGVCLTFVFASLVESVIVQYLSRCENEQLQNQKRKPKRKSDNLEMGLVAPAAADNQREARALNESNTNRKRWWNVVRRLLCTARGIDIISRIVFPLLFVIFLALYWSAYVKVKYNYREESDASVLLAEEKRNNNDLQKIRMTVINTN